MRCTAARGHTRTVFAEISQTALSSPPVARPYLYVNESVPFWRVTHVPYIRFHSRPRPPEPRPPQPAPRGTSGRDSIRSPFLFCVLTYCAHKSVVEAKLSSETNSSGRDWPDHGVRIGVGSGMGTASRAQRLAGASIGQRQRHSGGRLQTDETKLQRHARAMRPTPYTLYSLYGRVGGHFCEERSRARA